MIRRILHLGEEPLREVSDPVGEIDDSLRTLVEDMFETMYQAKGVGLAAPQVGVNKRLVIVDVGEDPIVFINPSIEKATGKEIIEEGCLSVPGLREKVERPNRIVVEATDLEGNRFEMKAEGMLARAIQHEIDHIEGILFVDRISKARRFQLKRDLERIAAGESLEE